MFKTLSAALIAASVMLAPMAVSANAAPAAKPVATKQVMVKKHARHVVRHHSRAKFVKQARHLKTFAHKRHGKIVKAHKRAHVVAARTRVRAN
jgi:Ni/Co efflux regulator RcnB